MQALYAVSVRQARLLPPASFRFHLAMDTLAFGYMLPVIRAHWGLSPVRTCPCWAYKEKKPWKNPRLWWEQRESNPRPSACKADALNQLSYAPDKNSVSFETDCKYTAFFRICKFYLHFLRLFRHFKSDFKPFYLSFRVKSGKLSKKSTIFAGLSMGMFWF